MPLKYTNRDNVKASAGNSVQFNGSTNYLSLTYSSALNLTGTYTMEGWIRITSTSALVRYLFQMSATTGVNFAIVGIYVQNGAIIVETRPTTGGALTSITSATTLSTNTWYHVAVSNNANSCKLFINGVQDSSGTISTMAFTPSFVAFGRLTNGYTNNQGYHAGDISNFRIVTGTSLYNSNFTPPTSPLTAIANTQLLTCHAATIVDGSSNNFTITNNNGATVSSISPFSGTFKFSNRNNNTSIARLGFKIATVSAVSSATQKAIFGYGTSPTTSITNLVSNTGVVATDTTGVGTARYQLAAAGYGTDKAIFGYGWAVSNPSVSMTNLVSNTGVVATDTTGVGTGRFGLAAAGYGTDKAIFGYGSASNVNRSMTNLVSNTGVVATDTTGVGTARYQLAAAGYGTDKAIFGYGWDATTNLSVTNLVSNTGVVATDTTGVGTARYGLAAASYGTDKAIFGYGWENARVSITNKVSNTGVVATDTTGVGTVRTEPAAAGYGTDKAIFGYGSAVSGRVSITNLVSNAGVVATDTTGVGTVRSSLAAAGYSLT